MVGATNAVSQATSANRTPEDHSSPSKRHIVRQMTQERQTPNSAIALVRSATDRIPSSTQANNVGGRTSRVNSTSTSTIMPHSTSIVTSSAPTTTAKLVVTPPSTSQQPSPSQSPNSEGSANAERNVSTTKTVDGLPPLPNNKQSRRMSVDLPSNSSQSNHHHHTTVASKIKSFFSRGSRASKSTRSKTIGSQMTASTSTT